jgi:Sel1 repeat
MGIDMRLLTLSLAACLGLVLATSAAVAVDNRATDQESQALLLKIEQQLVGGHFITPPDDNAVNTWEEYLARTAPSTPVTTRELAEFAVRMRSQASEQVLKGKPESAAGLTAFADMADSLLAELTGKPATRQAVPDAPSSAAVSPPVNVSPETSPSPKEKSAAFAPPVAASSVTLPPSKGRDAAQAPTASSGASPPLREKDVALVPPVAAPKISSAPRDKDVAAGFLSRGNALLAAKDISGARKFYEYAADLGDASAAMAMGRTFDPYYLNGLGVMGLQANAERAVNWYRRAAALGSQDARRRLQAMGASQ